MEIQIIAQEYVRDAPLSSTAELEGRCADAE